MIWGCFIKNSLRSLVKLEERINVTAYVDMLKNSLLPFIDALENKENYIFQEDNAFIHTANITKKWRRNNNITNLS